ncbi:MAG: M36 family metallopeptidase [Saprospiraceae bacterium]|nr:M36 family metallopeptidase [Saprospiraceae bacterium]
MTTRLVYLPSDSSIVLTWEVFIEEVNHGHMMLVYINAESGDVQKTTSLTNECDFNLTTSQTCHNQIKSKEKLPSSTNHIKSDQPATFAPNSYLVYPIPLEAPNEGPQSAVVAPWTLAVDASPFGWHDTNGAVGAEFTITRGNNVWAKDDVDGNDIGGSSPNGGANLDFNFVVDTSMQPATYLNGAITNLFYMNNIMHDVTYKYGFTEAAGNFQVNNYGKGGFGNDEVLADAQDGTITNNANFGTPIDGMQPRMQMFRWTQDVVLLDVNAPGNVAGPYPVSGANFNPMNSTATGDVVQAQPVDGCSSLTNGIDINGKIALIDRGTCSFLVKVNSAIAAGATGVIIVNNIPGAGTTTMGGIGPLAIPSVMVSYEDGVTLKAQLNNGLNATLTIMRVVPDTDSDLDNGIIAHEYGHGISNRLTGGPGNISCLENLEQMGEGWSDYFSLMFQLKPGDLPTDPNGIGTYVLNNSPQGDGIRAFPYSTDLTMNPFTYNDIAGAGIPHGVGSVWCTMLWDMTWNLIEKYGYEPDIYATTGGNGIAMKLVMEGLKLQPCTPGFVDGRNAILKADTIVFAAANSCEIWRAFARRGLGLGASQGQDTSVVDGTESYAIPAGCPAEFLFPCTEESLTYSGVTIPDGTDERVNTSVAIDNSDVQTGDMVTIRAGQEINIQPTFEVAGSGLLLLEAKPCDDSGLLTAKMAPNQKMAMIQKSVNRQNKIER